METDTPMGLFRGIKFGTETYHNLMKRLCRYGLHCSHDLDQLYLCVNCFDYCMYNYMRQHCHR